VGREGKSVSVGHSLLVIFYHMLKYDVDYKDLGVDYFDKREPERMRNYLVKHLQRLGFQVTLTPQTDAA
jgi:hypothetical protein